MYFLNTKVPLISQPSTPHPPIQMNTVRSDEACGRLTQENEGLEASELNEILSQKQTYSKTITGVS